MKKILVILCLMSLLIPSLNVYATEDVICIGNYIFSVSWIDNTYYLPARFVFEELGFTVTWDANLKMMYANKDDITFKIDTIKNYICSQNSSEFEFNYPLHIIEGRLYIPLDDPLERNEAIILDFILQGV